ncbi:DUF7742 family protein [Roseinatronobacter sp. NSM]|uniref:DUF7742 family protein n=1 Tax=Roseinatronobacter sp. NSM TaxID=3457785 RepID=UPI0040361CCB
MREVTHGDLCAAARVLTGHARGQWPQLMAAMLETAHHGDCIRKRLGRVHPQFGNGTLMAAALARAPAGDMRPSDPRYLDALACVIAAVARWRAARRR